MLKQIKQLLSLFLLFSILSLLINLPETTWLAILIFKLFELAIICFFSLFLYFIGKRFALIIFKIKSNLLWAPYILLGLFLLNILFYSLSLFSLFTPNNLLLCSIAFILITLLELWFYFQKNSSTTIITFLSDIPAWIYLSFGGIIWIGFYASWSSFINYDVLVYHLQLPKEYLLKGKNNPLFHNVFSFYPQTTQWLNALFIVWKIPDAAKMFHWWMGTLTALFLWQQGKISWGKTSSILPALIFCLGTSYFQLSATALNDLTLTFACTVFVFTYLEALENHKAHLLPLSAILLGMAASIKWTAILLFLPATLFILTLRAFKKDKIFYLQIISAGLFFLLPLSIWFLRNYLSVKNPLFPFLTNIFHSNHWPQDTVNLWNNYHIPLKISLGNIFLLPLQWLKTSIYEAHLVFLFIPLLIVKEKWSTKDKQILVFIISGYLSLLITLPGVRYFLPLTGMLSYLVATAIIDSFNFQKIYHNTIKAILILLSFVSLGLGIIIGRDLNLNYSAIFPASTSFKWLNQNANKQKVLFLSEARVYLYDGPSVYHIVWDTHPLFEELFNHPETNQWDHILKRENIKYVLMNENELNRLRKTKPDFLYNYSPKKIFNLLQAWGELTYLDKENKIWIVAEK